MSKRKSQSQSMQVMIADISFEDDEDADQSSITGDSAKGSSVLNARVSNRAKKAKAIYDPSEHNGPVHKRKREALEKETEKLKSPVKTIKHTTGSSSKQTSDVVKATMPVASVIESNKTKAPIRIPPEIKEKIVADIKKRAAPKPTVPTKKEPASPTHLQLAAVKEPSKRIQARKQNKVQNAKNVASTSKIKKQRSESASTFSEDYDRASTIEMKFPTIPDVRKWSYQRVYEYFSNTLGFKPQEAVVFKDEEIDGEALMIMKRSDIVNTKFQNLKLGVALKMWTQILKFQTGSNDPTQGWK